MLEIAHARPGSASSSIRCQKTPGKGCLEILENPTFRCEAQRPLALCRIARLSLPQVSEKGWDVSGKSQPGTGRSELYDGSIKSQYSKVKRKIKKPSSFCLS